MLKLHVYKLNLSPPDPAALFPCRCFGWHRTWASRCPPWLLLLQCTWDSGKQMSHEETICICTASAKKRRDLGCMVITDIKRNFFAPDLRYWLSRKLFCVSSCCYSLSGAQRTHTCINTFISSQFLLCPGSRYPVGQKPHLPPLDLFLCLLGKTQYLMTLYFLLLAAANNVFFLFFFFLFFLDSSSWAHRPNLFWALYGFATGQGDCNW